MLGDMGRLYWVLLALAACGDDSNRKIADAPPGGQHDAPGQMDAPPVNTPVTVLVKDDAGPTQGAHVYFQANDSTVISSTTTDTGGTASAVMPMGGFVTVVPSPQNGKGSLFYHLSTWAGVKPGDHLILDDSGGTEVPPTNVTVVLPPDPNHTVGQYQVSTTCGVGYISVGTGSAVVATTTGTVSVYCATADVLVVALDIDGQAVSSFYVAAQAFVEGDTIDYSLKTFTNSATRNYQFTNNTDTADIPVTDVLTSTRGTIYAPQGMTLSGNPAVSSAVFPAVPTGALDLITADQYAGMTERVFLEWGTTGDYTQDWAAHLLPDFTADLPTFDTGTHALAWTTTGGALVPDLVGTQTYGSGNSTYWNWDMFGPGGTSLAFPALPTDLADFNYTHDPGINAIVTAKVPGGYDSIRATVFAGPHPSGATGTISVNRYIPMSTLAATRQAPKKRDVMRRWIRHR